MADEAVQDLQRAESDAEINAALIRLMKLSSGQAVYRGMSGGVMPPCFDEAGADGLQGGVEFGFLSTTDDRRVAFEYAGADGGIVLEIACDGAARGADLSWLSQYPYECEYTFPPLTLLETMSTTVGEGGARVYHLRPRVSEATMQDGSLWERVRSRFRERAISSPPPQPPAFDGRAVAADTKTAASLPDKQLKKQYASGRVQGSFVEDVDAEFFDLDVERTTQVL